MSDNKGHDDLLAKWLEGTLTEAELETLKETTDLEELAQTLQMVDQLEAPTFSPEESWKTFEQKIVKKEAKVRPISRRAYLLAAAAVAAVLLGIFFFTTGADVQMIAQSGEHIFHELPDGSTVRMQGPASIQYDNNTWNESRAVALEGVAFFDVERGNDFVVSTENGSVRVLGTSFEVDAGDELRVFCYTGKVGVNTTGLDQIVLEKGTGVVIKGGQVDMIENSMTQPMWIDGNIYLSDAHLQEVGTLLSELFGVQVQVDESLVNAYRGPIITDDLNQTLEMIGTTMKLNIEKIGTDTIKFSAY
ncbi:MAG: FecR family protein [Saprospiraceae bacterium]|nr:FecR family protein [Saprospiraceae bacterium]